MHRGSYVILGLTLFACTPSSSSGGVQDAQKPEMKAEPAPVVVSKAAYAKPPVSELKTKLSKLQYEVTQNAATEPPFRNQYWNNHEAGIYVDIVTGEPLFSSTDKFESGTGWPSFTKPIESNRVVEHEDDTLGMKRVEVVSKSGSSHLGHVFDDGPAPSGMRYCINSASLRFIPVSKLAEEGYGEYAKLFGAKTSAVSLPATSAPSATDNSCAKPPPGEKPGCNSDYQTAIFTLGEGDPKNIDGVLDVNRGTEGTTPAIEVTFDPAKVSYDSLVAQWTKGRSVRVLTAKTPFVRN